MIQPDNEENLEFIENGKNRKSIIEKEEQMQLWDDLKNTGKDIYEVGKTNIILPINNFFINKYEKMPQSKKKGIDETAQKIKKQTNKAIDTAKANVQEAKESSGGIWGVIKEKFTTAKDTLMGKKDELIEKSKEKIDEKKDELLEKKDEIILTTQGKISETKEQIIEKKDELLEKSKEKIDETKEAIVNKKDEIIDETKKRAINTKKAILGQDDSENK